MMIIERVLSVGLYVYDSFYAGSSRSTFRTSKFGSKLLLAQVVKSRQGTI
jgi:hypothetical protein